MIKQKHKNGTENLNPELDKRASHTNEISHRKIKQKKDKDHYHQLLKEKIEAEIKHASRPLLISRLIVKFPIVVLIFTLLVYGTFTAVVIYTKADALDNAHYRDYLVLGDPIVNNFDLMVLASEDAQTDYPDHLQPLRTTVENIYTTSLLFECGD